MVFFDKSMNQVMARWSFISLGSQSYEEAKLNTIRVLVGLISFYRFLQIFLYSNFVYDDAIPFYLCAFVLSLLFMYSVGFLVPLVTALLLVTYVPIELYLETFTLGTNVLILLVLMGFVLNTGQRFSLDSMLLKKKVIGVQWLYQLFANVSREQHKFTYFLVFLGFCVLNFTAVAAHLLDPYWLSGDVLTIVFTNPFYSRFYSFFREASQFSPQIYSFLCLMGIISQIFFQVFMLPLSFSRWGGLFIKVWGFIFFLSSLVLFDLSYLPFLELIMWCLFIVKAPSTEVLAADKASPNKPIVYGHLFYLASILVLFLYCGLIGANLMGHAGQAHQRLKDISEKSLPLYTVWMGSYVKLIGLSPPNVFNTPDVESGNDWVVIFRKNEDETWDMVPLYGEDGERLEYHKSDLVYYKTSIPLRRCLRLQRECEPLLRRVFKLDKRIQKIEGLAQYRVDFYRSELTNLKLENRFKKNKVKSIKFSME